MEVCGLVQWWNEVSNCDWSGFIPTIIATFIGFVLAILGAWLYDRFREKEERNNLIIDLKNEIQKIKTDLNNIKIEDQSAKRDSTKILRINPLKCYVWEAAVSTGKITLLNRRPWYSQLLKTYDTISDFNEWQLLKTTKILDRMEISPINIYLEELRVLAIEQIEDIITKM